MADVSHVEARTAAAAGKAAFAALPREEMLSQDSVSIAYDKEGGRFVWDILLPGMEVTEDVRKPVPQAPPDADLSKPLSWFFLTTTSHCWLAPATSSPDISIGFWRLPTLERSISRTNSLKRVCW